ncbi:hypothetical protein D5S18_18495 [Nocardia panacis]|uniref:RecT-like ssDNA binding protein n=1 Tax=Nocardia panacis TaxID=2340916 RepID=A0A3A4JVB3_9NOCA|nr:hypothetical protein [Nocardia panacis]RJO74143.1 hypothetical protein D5S18_18495 [Nocardia panacis]
MNQIQPYAFGEATATQLAATTTQTRGERSREWLDLFFQTAKAAEILAGTDFVPTTMKGKPAQVAAAMMKGYELDIDPLDALGNIFSVHGRIGFYAEFMRRRILQAGHEFRPIETSDTRAVVEGRRAGTEEWVRASFTAQQAKAAKIDLGGYPEDKLFARATSRLCKRVFPDVLSGAAIAEDLMDEEPTAAVRVPSQRVDTDEVPEPGTIQRARKPRRSAAPRPPAPEAEPDHTPVDAPPLPGDEPTTEPAPAAEPMATTAQVQKLNILLEKEGLKDRAAKLDYLSGEFGRSLASSKDLTKVEARQLIDYLERPVEPDSVAEAVALGDEPMPRLEGGEQQ